MATQGPYSPSPVACSAAHTSGKTLPRNLTLQIWVDLDGFSDPCCFFCSARPSGKHSTEIQPLGLDWFGMLFLSQARHLAFPGQAWSCQARPGQADEGEDDEDEEDED